MSEFEQRRTAPSIDYPVWRFEVLLATESTQGFEVLRFEEEAVGELVAVDEKGGGEGEVRMESARRLRWGQRACRESEVEFWVQACRVLERGCEIELCEGRWERVVAGGEGEHRWAWIGGLAYEQLDMSRPNTTERRTTYSASHAPPIQQDTLPTPTPPLHPPSRPSKRPPQPDDSP